MNIDDYLMARDLITNVYNVRQMNKVAKPLGDYGAAIGTSLIPYVGGPANVIGSLAGSLNEAPTEKEERDMDDNPTLSLVPGVGAYRVGRRLRAQTESDRGDIRHSLGTLLGDSTSALATTTAATILGAAIGAYGGKRYGNTGDKAQDIGMGAGIGAMGGMALGAGGSLLAQLIGAIKAGVTPTRTKAEQRAYANDPSVAAEFLVPGVATYNRFKSYGRSMADAKERDKKDEKKEDSGETKTASINITGMRNNIRQAIQNNGLIRANAIRKMPQANITQQLANRQIARHPGWFPAIEDNAGNVKHLMSNRLMAHNTNVANRYQQFANYKLDKLKPFK